MARSPLAGVARAAFFNVMIFRSISFASYPARYESRNGWYALLLLYIPSLTLWFIVLCNDNLITWVSSVWALYVWLSFEPIIGGSEPWQKRKGFVLLFGPDLLRMTLCLTPLFLLLLLNTFERKSEDRELLLKLAFQITLDLFDEIEMLQVILEGNELGIQWTWKRLWGSYHAFVFHKFSHFQLEENSISDKSIYRYADISPFRFYSVIVCL